MESTSFLFLKIKSMNDSCCAAYPVTPPCDEDLQLHVPIVLIRNGHELGMRPHLDHMFQQLTTVKHIVKNDTDRGCHIVRRTERIRPSVPYSALLPGVADQTQLVQKDVTWAGLEPVLCHLLKAAGHKVVRSQPSPPLPSPNCEIVARQGVVDHDLLKAVQLHDRLIVRYGSKVNRAWLVAQIALAYPTASILVAVSRRQEARWFGQHLRRWLPDVTVVTSDHPEPQVTGRVVVAMHICLGAGPLRTAYRDIYIAPDALESLSVKGKQGLDEAFRARCIGLLPDKKILAPHDADELRCYYGFEEVAIPAHGQHLLPIDVVFERMCGGPQIAADDRPDRFRRAVVWQNVFRNRRIICLAKAIVTADCQTLQWRFPVTAAARAWRLPQRVAIMVTGVEHALDLLPRLPGSMLLAGKDINVAGLAPADRKFLAARASQGNRPNLQIVTAAALEQVNLSQIDVVIRADAGSGDLLFENRQLLVQNIDNHRLLLIDFDDRTDPQLRRWSRWRRQAYATQGWYAPHADPLEERIKGFLASRPR